MRFFAKIIFTKLLRWQIEGELPEQKKMVIIVAPHTSWYDFYIGVLVRSLIRTQINFVGKKELFKAPFGWYFRWMGGTPVNRHSNNNTVDAISEIFKKREEFRLALAPEGTRKKVENWRTGFYFIACKAQVPIVPVAFDYGTKRVKIAPPFYPTNNLDKDMEEIRAFYKGVVGKVKAHS